MLPASNRGAGQCLGFPDVCNTPAGTTTVPIPYPNTGMNAQAQSYSQVVKVSGVNALNTGSTISQTMGDEAGSAHPTTKGSVTFTQGDTVVSIDRLPAIRLTSTTTQNNMNNTAGTVIVPSATNVTFCRRHDHDDGAAGASALEEAGTAMRSRSLTEATCLPGGILAVTLTQLGPDALSGVHGALRRAAPTRGLVIDLRGNPGGDRDAALDLAATFLPRGAVVAELLEPDGTLRRVLSEDGELTLPVALVVDSRTASAAELFAASLAAHGRALIVGRTTYGKSTVLRYDTAVDGTAAVVGRWRDPKGRDLHGVGLRPDVVADDDPVRLAWALLLRG